MITLTPADVAAWAALFPDVPRGLERIVMHWSGGTGTPNAVDRRAYHALVTGPHGWVVRGEYPLSANVPPLAKNYAMHVGGRNTGSAGVSWCGMRGSNALAGVMGPHPITGTQLHRGLAFTAHLCTALGLDVADPAHVFTHREAWELHKVRGRENHTKPDWIVLPSEPGVRGWAACGEWMRATAAAYRTQLALLNAPAKPLPPREVLTITPRRTWATTTTTVRVRPSPDTRRPPLAVLPPRTRVVADAYTETGEAVTSRAGPDRRWIRLADPIGGSTGWLWAGASDWRATA